MKDANLIIAKKNTSIWQISTCHNINMFQLFLFSPFCFVSSLFLTNPKIYFSFCDDDYEKENSSTNKKNLFLGNHTDYIKL